jgi:hypothetical protein
MEQWRRERLEARGYLEVSVRHLLGLTAWEVAWIELRVELRQRRKDRLFRKRARNFARSVGAMYKHG